MHVHWLLELSTCIRSSDRLTFLCVFTSRLWSCSGLEIPTAPEQLLGPRGPTFLTAMLRHGGHIPHTASVVSVRDTGVSIRDGVKGDKAILELEYAGLPRRSRRVSVAGQDADQQPPTRVFAKFNLRAAGPMRLLVEASEVCRCEAVFYATVAPIAACVVPSPRCFFADWCRSTGEFVLLSEVVDFGEGCALPAHHHSHHHHRHHYHHHRRRRRRRQHHRRHRCHHHHYHYHQSNHHRHHHHHHHRYHHHHHHHHSLPLLLTPPHITNSAAVNIAGVSPR
jgi:hypothetical protein